MDPKAQEEKSIRDALSDSFDKEDLGGTEADAPLETIEPVEPVKVEGEPVEAVKTEGDRGRDEKGRFKTKDGSVEQVEHAPTKKPKSEMAPGEPLVVDPTKAAVPPAPVESLRPPQSWKPAAREEWTKIPAGVQQEVLRREREIATTLQETADARQGYQKFREAIAPFEGMMRADNVDPHSAVQAALNAVVQLRTAPPQRKAQMLAHWVSTYLPGEQGIDLLAQALTGQPMQQAQQQPYQDPRIDALLAEVNQAKQAQVATLQEKARQGIQEVENLEFFEDVKPLMGVLLTSAASSRVAMSPKQAYDIAIVQHPEIAKVVQQRAAAENAGNPAGSIQRSRAAASSVKSDPAVSVKGAQPDDLRGEIQAAMSRAQGRR